MICIPQQLLFGSSNQEGWDRRGMQHVWKTGEVLMWGKETIWKIKDNIKINLQEVGWGHGLGNSGSE